MPLSWNEIRSRAVAFSLEWADETSEQESAQTFWNEFFNVFGVSRRRIASFEERVKALDGKVGFVDLLWKGVLLVEHKSRGKDLDRAYAQAIEYFPALPERDLPKYILVSDFARFRLYDLENDAEDEFKLGDLHENIHHFGFMAGYQTRKIKEQDPVNIAAAERMGRLHDTIKQTGYGGHALEVYLVRLLFCLFAEDTGIFTRRQFQDYIEDRTAEDGSDLGPHLASFFHQLNTPNSDRLRNLDEDLAAFPYVNGRLFDETLPPAAFDSGMRQTLLDCCALDWGRISPAIFGSLFQSIMDKEARRNLGAHYTSEQNILKLINPLFMDDLRAEFNKVKRNKNKLFEFHKKLRTLTFLDPACGCGNFLVIAYRELRLLELDVLRTAFKNDQRVLDVHQMIQLDVDQFYGIEIEEFPAQIAQVALWLMDHQMNQLVSQEFGLYYARIPLKSSAKIIHDNALRLDWNEVIPAVRLNFILGNPPFVGSAYQSTEQKQDCQIAFENVAAAGVLDYVAAWYLKASEMMHQSNNIRCAFVSTNSITQGGQVTVLWGWLLSKGVSIHFAHRTFEWSSEAKGKAAVHCVIVGFALFEVSRKYLFEYENIKGTPHAIQAKTINPYLVDAPTILIQKRTLPICADVPVMTRGSQPTDGGNLLLDAGERQELIDNEPLSVEWIKPYSMGDDFINGRARYCLWLKNCPPHKLKKMPHVMRRINAVKKIRETSSKVATRKLAATPTLFTEIRQPKSSYLAIPVVSSERRVYVPISFMDPSHIAGNKLQTITDATLFNFGVLTSTMHMAWMRTVGGRLKNDYSYSNTIVYNNFPWPKKPTAKQKQTIETKAQTVLDARARFPDSSLADLYDPLTMPPPLQKAHQALDKAVDAAYGRKVFNSEAARVAFLFDLYLQYTSPLTQKEKPRRKKRNPRK